MSYGIFPSLFRQISREQKQELESWIAEHEHRTLDFDQKLQSMISDHMSSAELNRLHREMKSIFISGRLPYPMSTLLISLMSDIEHLENDENRPQFGFAICALTSVLLRYLAVVCIDLYVEGTQASNYEVNIEIVGIIRKATDGQWLNLILAILAKKDELRISPGKDELIQTLFVLDEIFGKEPNFEEGEQEEYQIYKRSQNRDVVMKNKKPVPLQKISDILQYFLVFYRNHLVHGESLDQNDHIGACMALQEVFCALAPFWEYQCVVQFEETAWNLSNSIPIKTDSIENVNQKEIILMNPNKQPLVSLSPLLCIRQDLDLNVERIEEVFFINIGVLEREQLDYIGFYNAEHQNGKSLGTYDQFKKYLATIPTPYLPKEDRIDFSEYIQDKGKNFVGRDEIFEEIESSLQRKDISYIVLRAHAGMGKSAIMAQMALLHEEPATNNRNKGDVWVFHFCMHTQGRDTPIVAYRSLIAQICDSFRISKEQRKKYLTTDINELKDRFAMLLTDSKALLEKRQGEKLIIVIDALDEGISFDGDTIPSFIPETVPEHVYFITSFRVNEKNENNRVEQQLQHLPVNSVHTLQHANPLTGLNKSDVQKFLDNARPIGSPEVTSNVLHIVWDASSINLDGKFADPFYLRFVLDGVDRRRIFLHRTETIPNSLDEAFESLWLSLPDSLDFLCHRLLLTLGIMRDHGDDELFAELFNRDETYLPNVTLTPQIIAEQRIKIGKLLTYDGDRYTLFHDRFRYFLVGEQPDPIAEALGQV